MTPVQPQSGVTCLGARVAYARERLKLTQAELGRRLGFQDRQTLQAIESGQRRFGAEEMVRLIEISGLPLDFFTDPYRLVGEGRFSFRAAGAGDAGLDEFEDTAGRWIAFWREQSRRQKVPSSPLRPRLDLNAHSTYEDAQIAGEGLWATWQLGDVPAERLVEVAEHELGLLVLHVDMPAGISGAACQVPGGDTILVNRSEPEGRRHFDVAHELFHVLTWDALPPRRVDRRDAKGYKEKHIERLADNFAGGLLMPRALLEPLWRACRSNALKLQDWIAATALRFRVSGEALKWRLVNLKFISKADLVEVADEALAAPLTSPPPRFSRVFLECAGRAIERADVSVMRLVKLLRATGTGGLREMFAAHGVPIPSGVATAAGAATP